MLFDEKEPKNDTHWWSLVLILLMKFQFLDQEEIILPDPNINDKATIGVLVE